MEHYKLGHHIKLIKETDANNSIIDYENRNLLLRKKKEIDKYNRLWESYKKKTNQYEYIYTSNNNKYNICALNVVSRSFFKLHELLKDLNIKLNKTDIYACIAEGPGGFIQSINYNINGEPKIYGVTLLSNNKKIPYWSPIISQYKNVNLLSGIDNTGDILKLDNINHIIENIGKNTCNLLTSDGGIDYSVDYNNQETLSYGLLYSEILLSLNIQKNNGTFIIKIFDIFNTNTITLVYILYMCYNQIYITKPKTSRLSNSEKYIVCIGFIKKNASMVIPLLYKYFNNKDNLQIFLPRTFKKNIIEYNNMYTKIQMNSITKTIDMINNNERVDHEYKNSCAIEWCKNYELPIKHN
jgi:23S rRNA U2552 (ribose-2'-O)-methylase RlmE/FtsJ